MVQLELNGPQKWGDPCGPIGFLETLSTPPSPGIHDSEGVVPGPWRWQLDGSWRRWEIMPAPFTSSVRSGTYCNGIGASRTSGRAPGKKHETLFSRREMAEHSTKHQRRRAQLKRPREAIKGI